MNVHAVRSAGWAGIAFIVLVFISAFAPGEPPAAGAAPAAIGQFFDQHRTMLILAGWVAYPAGAFFLWFAVGLYAYLRSARDSSDSLPTFALANAIVATAIATISGTIQIALATHASSELGAQVIRAFYDLSLVTGTILFAPIGIFIFAVALSGLREGSMPPLLAWFGYLSAILCGAASLTVLGTSGPLALGGMGALLMGIVPLTLWTVATGIVMIRHNA
jgi:hypothetical protein